MTWFFNNDNSGTPVQLAIVVPAQGTWAKAQNALRIDFKINSRDDENPRIRNVQTNSVEDEFLMYVEEIHS